MHASMSITRAAVLMWLASMLLLTCPGGHAQVYPCPGAGPGEIVVGQTQGGQGVASMPLCQQVGQAQRSPGMQQAPLVPHDYGAFAIDEHGTVYPETSFRSQEEAESMALDWCKIKMKGSCRLLGWFRSTRMTFARDTSGEVYSGTLEGESGDPAKNAMNECNKNTSTGKCVLLSMPMCAGTGREGGNTMAAQASPDLLEFLSAKLDARDYWGAIAYDGTNMADAHDEPSKQLAESKATGGCNGCKIVAVFKNTCAAIARPIDKRRVFETAEDTAPDLAGTKAAAQCSTKYGTCETQVRCSGRTYPKANPQEDL